VHKWAEPLGPKEGKQDLGMIATLFPEGGTLGKSTREEAAQPFGVFA